ncbi:MAG: S9 family peptidase, partial [Pseudomonadota bacterium]
LQAKTLPLEHFTKRGDYLDMKLSPDGKHIAARVRQEGLVSMVVLNTETMQVVGGVKPNNGDEVHSVEWINSERLVYQFAEKRVRSERLFATGELFAMNYDNSKNRMLFGYRAGSRTTGTNISKRESTMASAEVISYLPDDDKRILIAEYPFTKKGNKMYNNKQRAPRIQLLDVYSGRKRKVDAIPYNYATVFASDAGDINFVSYTDDQLLSRAAYRLNEKDEWKDLSEVLGKDMIPAAISSDGKKVYLTGNIGEKNLKTMFEFDLTTKAVTKLFEPTDADLEYYLWDRKLQQPVVGISYPDKHKYYYSKVKSSTAKYHKTLAASFGGQKVLIQSESRDGKYVLLHVSSDVNPGEYYLFNTESKSASFLWANRSWLDPRDLAATKHFSFTTSDDQLVNGYVTLPKNAEEDKPVPFVTMIHGGPHGSRDYAEFDSEVKLLANRGYAVVQINFRGSDGYGKDFKKMGHREWGGAMIQDILEGTNAAIEQFALDADKGCVYGASYGGYAAMMSSIREPSMFNCVIGFNGLYNLSYFFTESDTAVAYGGLSYLKRVLGDDQEALDANSPVYHADKISAKVLIIHGEKDARVPVINAETMIDALENAGNKPKYLNLSRSDHWVVDENARKKVYETLLDFLDDNLG